MGDESAYCILEWKSHDGSYSGKESIKTHAQMLQRIDALLDTYQGDVKFEVILL